MRKVMILGSARTALETVPLDDPSWEKWGIGFYDRGDAARLFEMHAEPTVIRIANGEHLKRLGGVGCPVYMRRTWPEIPTSVAYPVEAVLADLGGDVDIFAGTECYMLALAIHELEPGDAIYLGGLELLLDSQHGGHRPAVWYLTALARGRGITVEWPAESVLFRHETYGEPRPVLLPVEALEAMRAEYERQRDRARTELHTFNGALQAIERTIELAKHALKGGKAVW